jgi:hypothetical protein
MRKYIDIGSMAQLLPIWPSAGSQRVSGRYLEHIRFQDANNAFGGLTIAIWIGG